MLVCSVREGEEQKSGHEHQTQEFRRLIIKSKLIYYIKLMVAFTKRLLCVINVKPVYPPRNFEVGTISISILKKRKLKHRKVTYLDSNHLASKLQNWDLI